jgi:SAM-dependent methyltransferase
MDVVDLREFYAGRLGHAARRLLAHRMRARFGGARGATVLGLGFAVPYLEGWRDEAERIIAFMPATQGVMHWPAEQPGRTALVDDTELPLPDRSVDVALVVHELELSDHITAMLRELWRVLAPQGRALFVVPNRRGMWARFDSTPFGHGRPFSRQQLTEILRGQNFAPTGWANALFVPPFDRGFFVRSAPAWERIGLWVSPGFSGILMVEAVKQVYAVSAAKKRKLVPRFDPQIAPVPALRCHPARQEF